MSRAAVRQAAAASAVDGMQMHGGQHTRPAAASTAQIDADGAAALNHRARPWWVTMAIEVSHCGSGCALGDVISEFAIFALGPTIAGLTGGRPVRLDGRHDLRALPGAA